MQLRFCFWWSPVLICNKIHQYTGFMSHVGWPAGVSAAIQILAICMSLPLMQLNDSGHVQLPSVVDFAPPPPSLQLSRPETRLRIFFTLGKAGRWDPGNAGWSSLGN